MSNTYDLSATLTEAAAKPTIPNVEYLELKRRLSYLIEKEFEAWKQEYLKLDAIGRNYGKLTDFYYAQIYPHTLAGWIKRAKDSSPHELRDSFIFIGRALLPLVNTLFSMKDKIVKRNSVPSGRPPSYVPLMAEFKSIKVVTDVLKEMTDPLMDEYTKILTLDYIKTVEDFQSRLDAAKTDKEKSTIYYNSSRRLYSYVENSTDRWIIKTLKADYRSILADVAKKDALASQRIFISKNVAKLAKIVELKGNDVKPEIKHAYINASGIYGLILFTFGDGSSFSVQNKIVFNRTAYECGGRTYLQFPTTFHNAIKDVTRWTAPSHKIMIEKFAGV